jgi:2-C-methyl-D-erythritol 4-phosphate cytidylyltransferase
MVEWSIDAFRACGSVRAIVVAVPPGLAAAESSGRAPDLWQVGPRHGPTTVVEGGATRAESVSNAVAVVGTELVAIHDAARPLVTPELVEALVALLDRHSEASAAIPAVPITDTVKRASGGGRSAYGVPETPNADLAVEKTLDRSELWGAQTPQVFRTDALRTALAVDETARDAATDEAMLVEQVGGTVLIHPSGPENLKITTPLDLRMAELLLGERRASGTA